MEERMTVGAGRDGTGMFKGIDRFAELYERQGRRFKMLNGILWTEHNRMVLPVGPAHLDYSISEAEGRLLLSSFPGSLLARYGRGFKEQRESGPWYSVICDKLIDLNRLPSKQRTRFNRGFKHCRIRRVEPKYIADRGYGVFSAAFRKYRGAAKPGVSEDRFRKNALAASDFDDIIQYWGAFCRDQLAAFAIIHRYDDASLDYAAIRFHPGFLKYDISYAMMYAMNDHYLREQGLRYVNNGSTSLWHQTNFQEFLLEKFEYRKAYMDLSVTYRPIVSFVLNLTFPIRKAFYRSGGIKALYRLEEIRRECGGQKLS